MACCRRRLRPVHGAEICNLSKLQEKDVDRLMMPRAVERCCMSIMQEACTQGMFDWLSTSNFQLHGNHCLSLA